MVIAPFKGILTWVPTHLFFIIYHSIIFKIYFSTACPNILHQDIGTLGYYVGTEVGTYGIRSFIHYINSHYCSNKSKCQLYSIKFLLFMANWLGLKISLINLTDLYNLRCCYDEGQCKQERLLLFINECK
jgi:hypothetical protein